MERIKDLGEVILRGDSVLCECFVKQTKGGIILAEDASGRPPLSHMVVIAIGKDVDDIIEGDIVVHVAGNALFFKINGKDYAKFPRYNAEITVKPENFDADMVVTKTTDLKPGKGTLLN